MPTIDKPMRVRKRSRANTIAAEITTGSDKDKPETISVPVDTIDGEPAFVSVGQRVTINLGNYESVQLNVQVTIPCKATPEAIDTAKDWAAGKVDVYLKEEIAKST